MNKAYVCCSACGKGGDGAFWIPGTTLAPWVLEKTPISIHGTITIPEGWGVRVDPIPLYADGEIVCDECLAQAPERAHLSDDLIKALNLVCEGRLTEILSEFVTYMRANVS